MIGVWKSGVWKGLTGSATAIVVGLTRAQYIGQVREVMDAVNSTRWSDSAISGVLGLVHRREWSGLLGANPYYRHATRSVSSAPDGTLAYTALNSGSGDSTQTWSRILAVSDGNTVYRQTTFAENPLAASSGSFLQYDRMWYDAGSNLQVLPAGAVTLSVTVNWIPPRVDQLSADTSVVDFPDGHESVLWFEAAAMLLSKGGAENDAAQTMRAIAEQERQTMYSDIQRRSAKPISLGYPDRASEWGT